MLGALGWAVVSLYRQVRAADASRLVAVEEARRRLDAIHREELATLARRDAEAVERLHAMYTKGVETLGNVLMYGSVVKPPAEIKDPELTAAERIAQRVDEDIAERAFLNLRREYDKLGMSEIPDDEVRAEARRIMANQGFLAGEATRERLGVG